MDNRGGAGMLSSSFITMVGGLENMKKISAFWLALFAGVILEGVIVALAWLLGAAGTRFGPVDGFSSCIYAIHLPGLWIAEQLPYSVAWLGIPMIIISTIVLLSVISFFVICILRRFYAGKSQPAA